MSKSAPKPILAITPGDPAGIGPDLITQLDPSDAASLVVIADPAVLQQRAKHLAQELELHVISGIEFALPDKLNVLAMTTAAPVIPGVANPANGSYVINCLEQAVQLCESGRCDALVTGPVNKAVINESGIAFSGHTEWLANRLKTQKVVMMLASGNLRVALVTTHLPLREVADAITKTELASTLDILHNDLQNRFGLKEPTISVCGLNPHAGEGGYLGHEEIETIQPVLEKARQQGIKIVGPLPADTAFTQESLKGTDVVLAMYHDQGLPVLKHQGFGNAINVTLGLPIIRTSVDHGTAFDIAGTGAADSGSLICAIKMAEQLALTTK